MGEKHPYQAPVPRYVEPFRIIEINNASIGGSTSTSLRIMRHLSKALDTVPRARELLTPQRTRTGRESLRSYTLLS